MKIFDYHTKTVKEITDAQYDFLQLVIKNGGNLTATINEYPVTPEELGKWKKDPFWAILDGHVLILIKSRGLNADAVKEFYLDAMYGTTQPTKSQTNAANGAARLLLAAYNPRNRFTGKATMTPENVVVEFSDGLNETETDNKDKPLP